MAGVTASTFICIMEIWIIALVKIKEKPDPRRRSRIRLKRGITEMMWYFDK